MHWTSVMTKRVVSHCRRGDSQLSTSSPPAVWSGIYRHTHTAYDGDDAIWWWPFSGVYHSAASVVICPTPGAAKIARGYKAPRAHL